MPGLNQILRKSSRIGSGNILSGAQVLGEDNGNLIDFPRIPTGIFPVDYASGGGIPCNQPTQLYGLYQGGKSTLAYLIAKNLTKTCMRCLQPVALCKCVDPDFIDVCPTCGKPAGECSHKTELVEKCDTCKKGRLDCECGSRLIQKTFLCHLEGLPPDELYFNTLGYDTQDNLIIGIPEYGEQACEMVEAAIRADDCGLVIMDSIAALLPKAELDGAYEDFQVGAQSRLVSKLFRRISSLLVREFRRGHLVGLIFINQVRANIGAGKWEPSEKTPGGLAAKHGHRLSMRVNQLSVDSDKGEKDKADGMKNVARFSVSFLGAESKQQVLILAGKAEYKIVLRDWEGYESGACLDAGAAIAVAKEIGMLEKTPRGYELKGADMIFRVLSDIEEMFRTGRYVEAASGEVLEGGDDIFRYFVVQRAKKLAVESIMNRSEIRVNMISNPQG
ncbi:MAG: DNA recombination/repair protein RecA [Desulfovibrio sp.]|jgi:RecA/RadA recombinase|nr:DNA recombination/repair protein RecA [Desulfovibrio sp.]